MSSILRREHRQLWARYTHALWKGKKPAVVFDADDTTLWTYDMEVDDLGFTFDPARQNSWVQGQRFPATTTMVTSEKTVGNAAVKCTTIEYKSQTRKHLQTAPGGGYRIVANFRDQFSDLAGRPSEEGLQAAEPDVLPALIDSGLRSAGPGNRLVMTDHLGNHEVEELLGELRIQPSLFGQQAEPLYLFSLTGGIGSRQPMSGLQDAHLLGDPEPLGQQMDQGSIHVVDAVAELL